MKIGTINDNVINATQKSILEKYPGLNPEDISSRLKQVAELWTANDGNDKEFTEFCVSNYLSTEAERTTALEKISKNLEILYGRFHQINTGLKEQLQLDLGSITAIDNLFGSYDVSGHLAEDFFNNKIAFYILLNFHFSTLEEKTKLAETWTRKEWAMTRLAELFKSRVPSALILKFGEINTRADSYISDYNVYMGNIVENNQTYFTNDVKLITHWGLRDEIKANYNTDNGLKKQQLIYAIMMHIINQDIPKEFINSDIYQWNPIKNTLFKDGKSIEFTKEPDTRYEYLLASFNALRAMDAYNPFYPTYIQDKFENEMEIPLADVEKLFTDLLSSSQVKKVASLIQKQIGRKLEPFDIWYDGFKSRNSVNTNDLDNIVRKKYPTNSAFEKDIPNILIKLGFEPNKAEYIASKIQVDASRGAGHASGAAMKGDKARLRTRVGSNGMDYKGFNIAMHELGHCVEQTLTLYDIDYYLLNGVPNTAFTEALAFIFQKRDLEVLGVSDTNTLKTDLMALDIFWSNYEIMGVSLVDIGVWKWMYAHPEADKVDLKKAVIQIANEVWNKYYADIFGIKNQPILAIYSHMIDYPLYLPAYPVGHLIDFQIEKQIEGKIFGDEVIRIYSKGRITPQEWMKNAVGQEISIQPLLQSVDQALVKMD